MSSVAKAAPAVPLSDSQQKIFDLICNGSVKSIADIARRVGATTGVVHAQITRILNRGQWHANMRHIKDIRLGEQSNLPNGNVAPTVEPTPSGRPADGPVKFNDVRERGPVTGGPSNDSIAEALKASGKAMTYEELAQQLQAKMPPGSLNPDVQPMILMGVAIQFMKLTGGRLAAHQLIEDVYNALKMLSQ